METESSLQNVVFLNKNRSMDNVQKHNILYVRILLTPKPAGGIAWCFAKRKLRKSCYNIFNKLVILLVNQSVCDKSKKT
jgi:hypothetical protein